VIFDLEIRQASDTDEASLDNMELDNVENDIEDIDMITLDRDIHCPKNF
jgi:hypothetical protein